MGYMIRMGIPEMQELWDDLQQKYRAGTINKDEEKLYKKWGNALKNWLWILFIQVCRLMKFHHCQNVME